MSLTPEPTGVAQAPLFPAGRLDAPRGAAPRTGSSWATRRGDERLVPLVFSANVAEYEQAQVEVETSPRPPDKTRPGGREEGDSMTPVPADGVRDGGRRALRRDNRRAAPGARGACRT